MGIFASIAKFIIPLLWGKYRQYVIVLLIGGGVFVWWQWDKRAAVKAAIVEYVAASEHAAKDAVIKELAFRSAVNKLANEKLQKQIALAQVETLLAEKELEEYAANTTVNPECVVDPDLLERLRSK